MQASYHYEEAQAHLYDEVNGSTIKSCEVERELISKLESIQRCATYLLQRKTNVGKPTSCVLLARVTRSSILLQGYA